MRSSEDGSAGLTGHAGDRRRSIGQDLFNSFIINRQTAHVVMSQPRFAGLGSVEDPCLPAALNCMSRFLSPLQEMHAVASSGRRWGQAITAGQQAGLQGAKEDQTSEVVESLMLSKFNRGETVVDIAVVILFAAVHVSRWKTSMLTAHSYGATCMEDPAARQVAAQHQCERAVG